MAHDDHPIAAAPKRRFTFLPITGYYLILVLVGLLLGIDADLVEPLGNTQGWWDALPLTPAGIWLLWLTVLLICIGAQLRLLKQIGQHDFSMAIVILVSAYLITPVAITTAWLVRVSTLICECELDRHHQTLEQAITNPGSWIPSMLLLLWIPGIIMLMHQRRQRLQIQNEAPLAG